MLCKFSATPGSEKARINEATSAFDQPHNSAFDSAFGQPHNSAYKAVESQPTALDKSLMYKLLVNTYSENPELILDQFNALAQKNRRPVSGPHM